MNPDETTLSRLAAASQAGDREAYTTLLKECARWLSRYYARRIAPAQLEDLVQDTLLSVHRKLRSYNPDQPFLPWIAAIARYRWIDALRKSYRCQEITIDGQDLAEAPEQEVAFAKVSLERLFTFLPEGQMRAIELVKIEGLSIREAAEKCGQSESLVKVNIHRGLKKLQAVVEEAS